MIKGQRFLLSCLLMLGMVAGGCAKKNRYNICVLQWGEATVYYDTYKGLTDGLNSRGYEKGRNLNITHVVAKGDYHLAKNTIKKWARLKPDLVITLGTKATLAAKEELHAEGSHIPLVFTACAFPYLTGIISSYSSQKGITGIGAEIPAKERVELMVQALPHLKKVAIPYFPDNPQAVITATETKRLLEEKGITGVAFALSRKEGIDNAIAKIRKVVSECDLLYLPTDPVLYVPSTLKRVIHVATEQKKPAIGVTLDSVKNGAMLALHPDYYEQGVEAADIVNMVLNGVSPSKVVPHPTQSHYLAINLNTARKLGIAMPRNMLLTAKEIIDTCSEDREGSPKNGLKGRSGG